jgi:hypothetical protein
MLVLPLASSSTRLRPSAQGKDSPKRTARCAVVAGGEVAGGGGNDQPRPGRYCLLETIRDYALSKLDAAGEAARLRHRHLELFLTRAEMARDACGRLYALLTH